MMDNQVNLGCFIPVEILTILKLLKHLVDKNQVFSAEQLKKPFT